MANQRDSKDMAKAEHSVLPPKDASTFRQMMDLYNMKQFKKSLKVADALLLKYPNHGEVLSFRALILTNTDPNKRDEIMQFAREGLRHDLKSYLCWHVLGVVYKQRKMFKDSVKCFITALRLDPRNDRLVRDICSLHIELGDYSNFRKYASIALQLKSTSYREWMVYSLSHYMCGSIDKALKISQEAQTIFSGSYGVEPFEISGSILYTAMLMEQCGQYDECIQFLINSEHLVLDVVMHLERLGRAAVFAKRWDVAHQSYKKLAAINTGSARYHLLYVATHKDVIAKDIFCFPESSAYSVIAAARRNHAKVEEAATFTENCALDSSNPKEAFDKAVLLGEEILDIDGIYSTANWHTEKMVNRVYDRFVNRMRILAEPKDNPTKDEKLFIGCYSYAEYVRRVGVQFDVADLPNPYSVKLENVEHDLAAYLYDYPLARNCVYDVRSKITQWSRYPLFIYTRDIAEDESHLILSALSELNTGCYLVKVLRIFFMPKYQPLEYHALLDHAIKSGSVNVMRYFERTCTFVTVYYLMVLLSKYESNLSQGYALGKDIIYSVDRQSSGNEVSLQSWEIAMNQYRLVVCMLKARLCDFIGKHLSALEILEGHVREAPTSVELHLFLGKVYRHVGRLDRSNIAFCRAYDIDRSDRQTSTKAAKSLLRAGYVERSRDVWRHFLMEDAVDSTNGTERGDELNDVAPEIKSIQYELMVADLYKSLYLIGGDSSGCDTCSNGDALTYLTKLHDIYVSVLERHHEMYLNQIDFHNYCLNRLHYHAYSLFHFIRENYATQSYFMDAVQGVFWTSAEIHRMRISHETTCERALISNHENTTINYCLDLLHIVNSQRVYHPALYVAIYEFSCLVPVPPTVKAQLLMRAYEACNGNSYHHSLYPMVLDIILKSEYKEFPQILSLVIPVERRIALDKQAPKFCDMGGNELIDEDAAALYLEDITRGIRRMGLREFEQCEALVHCSTILPTYISRMISTLGDLIHRTCTFTFEQCRIHRLRLRRLGEMATADHSASVTQLIGELDRYAETTFATAIAAYC